MKAYFYVIRTSSFVTLGEIKHIHDMYKSSKLNYNNNEFLAMLKRTHRIRICTLSIFILLYLTIKIQTQNSK